MKTRREREKICEDKGQEERTRKERKKKVRK
jgi:hypothetical protein